MKQTSHNSRRYKLFYVPYSLFRGSQSGFSLVEILVSIAVFSFVLFAVIAVFITARESSQRAHAQTKAILHQRDYIEKLKNIRRNNWDDLINGRYIFDTSGTDLVLSATTDGETIDGYTRYIEIEDAYRDTSGELLDSPGLIDPSTKKITTTVSWEGFRPGSISQSMYLTRYLDNLAWIQTTEDDFNAGEHDGTNVVNNEGGANGGEVVLGAGGSGNWCEPGDAILEELDYPGTAEARAISAIEGRAFTGTGRNASGLPFALIDISNTNPPVAEIIGTYENVSPGKSNDVFGEEDYAYIATDDNNREIIIIDLTVDPLAEAGYFNPQGNNKGIALYVSGDVGYMTTESANSFRSFDVAEKSGSRDELDVISLAGVGYSIFVRGDYAYISVDSTTTQMQIVDVSDPGNLSIVSSLSLNDAGGRDIYVNETGTRAYVATENSLINPEFFIVDVSDKQDPQLISGGEYDTGEMSPTGIRVVPGGRAIVVGESGGERYQVVNISNEGSPVRCGGLNVTDDIYGVDAVLEEDGDAYSYIVTADANAEFKVVEGGPGGAFAATGVYESQTLDTTFNSTGFNRFFANYDLPAGTSIRFQVAAKEPAAGGCTDTTFSDFDFVAPGEDGEPDPNSYYVNVNEGIIPMGTSGGYKNPSQCFRLRAELSTDDSTFSPILYDFLINYSP